MKNYILFLLSIVASTFGSSAESISHSKYIKIACGVLAQMKSSDLKNASTLFSVEKMIEDGDECALKFQFRIRADIQDDPDLSESLDISVGEMITKKPQLFLSLLKEYLSKQHGDNGFSIDGMLGNFPEECADKYSDQTKIIDSRIDVLEKISNSELIEIRDKCVNLLLKERKVIEEGANSNPPNYVPPRQSK